MAFYDDDLITGELYYIGKSVEQDYKKQENISRSQLKMAMNMLKLFGLIL